MATPHSGRTWVIVASLDHARRGLDSGFVMANHGKRAPLARMSAGDGILIYSPKTAYPDGQPLRAIAIVGTITGSEPEPSDIIPGGFRRGAKLRSIDPIGLADLAPHLPTGKLRFGCFELDSTGSDAIWARIEQR